MKSFKQIKSDMHVYRKPISIVVGVCMHLMFRMIPTHMCVSVEQETNYWNNKLS